jgi:hypothetical protein
VLGVPRWAPLEGHDMEELDKEFVEPVVLGHLPFEMDADVAREAVLRTHQLVLRLTAANSDRLPVEDETQPHSRHEAGTPE